MKDTALSQLWQIAKEVASIDTTWRGDFGDQYCVFCAGEEDYGNLDNYQHAPECIVLMARTLVEQQKTQ